MILDNTEEKLNDEQRELVTKNVKLAYFLAHKWNKKVSYLDYDDIEFICLATIIKCALRYDEKKGANFATYTAKSTKNNIFCEIKKKKNQEKVYCFSDMEKEGEWIGEGRYWTELREALKVTDDNFHTADFIVMKEALSLLDNVERKALEMYYLEGELQEDIAIELDFSQSYISRLLERALENVKKIMEGRGGLKYEQESY